MLASILVGLLIFGLTMPVVGHAYLSGADPANGERTGELPDEVTLHFTGDGVVLPSVDITGPDGEVVSGEAYVDPDDSHQVHVPIDVDAGDGMYIIDWDVLAEDGHTTRGTLFFSVGEGPLDRETVIAAIQDGDEEEVPLDETAAKGLILVSLVGLIGMPVALIVAVRPVMRRFDVGMTAIDRRILTILLGLTGILLIGVIALGFARMGGFDSELLTDFIGQRLGRVWIGQIFVSLVLLSVLVLAREGIIPRYLWGGSVVAGGVLIAAGVGWTSHSATIIGRVQGFAVDFAHIAGAGLWVGGLAVLALVVPMALTSSSHEVRAQIAADVIRRFSVLAMGGVTVALATGFVLAAWHVPSIDALVASVYGTALGLKVALVLLALGLGSVTRFLVIKRLEGSPCLFTRLPIPLGKNRRVNEGSGVPVSETVRRVRRTIRLELVVLVLVILISGMLTSAPTAALVADQPTTDGITIEAEEHDITVTVGILPAESVGEWAHVNEGQPIVIDVWFEREGELVDSDRTVRLLADHSASSITTEITLDPGQEPGMYSGVHVLPEPGVWEVRITGDPGGQFHSQWIEVFAVPTQDADDEHDHDHGAGLDAGLTFPVALLIGSMVIAILGGVLTIREARAVTWFEEEH